MNRHLHSLTWLVLLGLLLTSCGGAATPEASEPAAPEATEVPTTTPETKRRKAPTEEKVFRSRSWT